MEVAPQSLHQMLAVSAVVTHSTSSEHKQPALQCMVTCTPGSAHVCHVTWHGVVHVSFMTWQLPASAGTVTIDALCFASIDCPNDCLLVLIGRACMPVSTPPR
jgi:hypothetical protein